MKRGSVAGLALVGASIALGFAVEAARSIDVGVFRALAMIEGMTPGWAIELAQGLTSVGNLSTRVVILLCAIAAFLLARRRGEAIVLVAGTLTAVVATSVIKEAFGRARPFLVPHLSDYANPSFPSGHASNTMAMLLLLALLTRRPWAIAAALGLAFAVGWSRVALGVHWPTDVIGGWMLGAGIALVAAGAARGVAKGPPPAPPARAGGES